MKEAGAIQIEKKKHRMDMCGFVPPEKKISHGKRCGAGEIRKQKSAFISLSKCFWQERPIPTFMEKSFRTELYAGADTSTEKALHWKNTLRSMGFQATGSTR